MDNLDDSENNAKISDSAYSNSCSNSQSRRSHSSKSTHSGSNSSGSSGYGGKPSTSGSSNQPPEKRSKEKDPKKKKVQVDTLTVQGKAETECRPPEPAPVFESPKKEKLDVIQTSSPQHAPMESLDNMQIVAAERIIADDESVNYLFTSSEIGIDFVTSRLSTSYCSEGFSCVVSMHDGVVRYTTSSLTATLGFPKDMWIGRSFIDFVHPRDRNTFASQITNGLAVPKIVNGTQEKVSSPGNSVSTMVCRIRRYKALTSGFGIKESVVIFMPFLLKLTFKNINEEEIKLTYLVIQATPFFSAFKVPNELLLKSVPFVMRHAANGHIEYLDPESVPYLGYLPQDVTDKDALQLYHPEDLGYLRHVYETIVQEGAMPRSKTYRMMTQNGDYIKLETEWSSFVNPWSRKLEFVIGKHHIVEGPQNPDVFQTPEPEKGLKMTEEERSKAQSLRDSIIRILNAVLTKPAEVAKQQMSKRCQDIASFMESLMEEPTKTDDEFRLELQEPDHSFYERDSVMLGGISPHHDFNDSKSSTETPLSYNQLNYNETLQRYFDRLQSYQCDDYNVANGEQEVSLKDPNLVVSCLSPMAQNSGDSVEITSSCENSMVVVRSSPDSQHSTKMHIGEYHVSRLTETLLGKHNSDMEKELMKTHREIRSSKSEREKVSTETRKKKKEHLARCNASFQPTPAETLTPLDLTGLQAPHGVKRTKQDSVETMHKHHCPAQRIPRTKQTNVVPTPPSTAATTTVASQWSTAPVNNMNTFILGVGIPTPNIGVPQPMSILSPVIPHQMAPMPGMFPMYYAPATAASMQPMQPMQPMPNTTLNQDPTKSTWAYQGPTMQCMMYGQAVYGSPFMYSPIAPQVSYPVQQSMMTQSMHCSNTVNPFSLENSNYEEACKPSLQLKSSKMASWRGKKRMGLQGRPSSLSSKTGLDSDDSIFSTAVLNQSMETLPEASTSRADIVPLDPQSKSRRIVTNDETVEKTDGESSYSSFYSSSFRTESGSAEESGDAKKFNRVKFWDKNRRVSENQRIITHEPQQGKIISRRKMDPPWMEKVCVTSELIYKYQLLTKNVDEVLISDQQKMVNMQQPTMVNEQLNQLYLDLQLEGVASRLTLEEGITSSSSSGEETSSQHKVPRRKREYSKLVMIYEEDAPMPPPIDNEDESA